MPSSDVSADRPKLNVLFILSDQHNAKVLGCKNHPDVQTPNLDRLAEAGVRFDNAITQNPICTPSRVSFLSGQYCHNHGYYGLEGPNPGGLPTFLGHFRRHGYRTGAMGKIHCPEYWVEDDCDVFHETCHCSREGRSGEYARYLAERGLTDLEDHGAMHELGDRGRQTVEGRPSKVSFEDSQEGWVANQAKAFMGECKQSGQPFCLHLSLPKPHQCYTPAQEFWDLYDPEKLTLPPNAEYEMAGKAPHLRKHAEKWRQGEWALFEPKTFEAARLRKLRGYLGNVSHVDHAVGLLLDYLDETGLAENTIVVYSSDHGDYACEQGQMEKAPGICSDAITRIPMMWRVPGVTRPGLVCEHIVESVDVSATVTSLAGLPPLETSDGEDLSALLAGGDEPVKAVGLTEFAFSRSLRKGDWRLVYYPPGQFPEEYPDGFGELYNLAEDPWEMTNRYFDDDCAEKVRELERDLLDRLIRTTRPKTILPPRQWTSPQAHTRFHHTVNADGKLDPDRIAEVDFRNYI